MGWKFFIIFSVISLILITSVSAITWSGGTIRFVNLSDFSNNWITEDGIIGTINETQLDNVGGTLSIIKGWIDGLWCSLSGCTMSGNLDMNTNQILNISDITLTQDVNISPFFWLVDSPVSNDQVVNKEYVDSGDSATAFDFFFNNESSDLGGHFNMTEGDLERPESSLDSVSLGQGDEQSIFNFTSLVGQPEFNKLRQGIYDVHVHLNVDGAGRKPVTITPKLYNLSSEGVRSLLVTFESSEVLTTSPIKYDLHGVLTDPIILEDGDRLNLELEANVGASGANPIVTIVLEGTTDSHLTVETSTNAFEKIFIRRDGTNTLTGNWDVGIFNITNIDWINGFNQINGSGNINTTGNITADYGFFDGRVGIGTTTPASQLEVMNDIRTNTYKFLPDNTATIQAGSGNSIDITATDVTFSEDILVTGDGTFDELFITKPSQNWKFTSTTTAGALGLQGQSSGTQTRFQLFTKDLDNTDSIFMDIYGVGTPTDLTGEHKLSLGYAAASDHYRIVSNDLDLQFQVSAADQLRLYQDGSSKFEVGDVEITAGDLDVTGDGTFNNLTLTNPVGDYKFGGDVDGFSTSIQKQSDDTDFGLALYSKKSDAGDRVYIYLYRVGTPENHTGMERFVLSMAQTNTFMNTPPGGLTLLSADGFTFASGDVLINENLTVEKNLLMTGGNLMLGGNKVNFGGDTNIYNDGTNLIFDYNTSLTSAVAWFSGNLSAVSYDTRTSVFDKSRGNALDWIKDSEDYKNPDGSIKHNEFYGYKTNPVTDKSRPETEEYEVEVCEFDDEKSDIFCHNETKYRTIYPYRKLEEAVTLNAEVDVLRQALFDLKQENNLFKSCLVSSKDFIEYKSCVGS